MLKILVFLLLFSSLAAFGGEEVCFKDLYRMDLMNRMEAKLATAQCIDLKKHMLSSLAFAKDNSGKNINYVSTCISKDKAIKYCVENKDVGVCDSLESFLLFKESSKRKLTGKDSYENKHRNKVIGLVSNKKLEEGGCLADKEYDLASLYTRVLVEVFKSDNGIAEKALNLIDNQIESEESLLDEDFLEDLQSNCDAEVKMHTIELYRSYTNSIKRSCLGDLAQKGFSIYDKEIIYCSGMTPLACTLQKWANINLE